MDASGNVWEWCVTKRRASYEEPEDNDLQGANRRVVRGGSWFLDEQIARAAVRNNRNPDNRNNNQGFRCARPCARFTLCGLPVYALAGLGEA
jgi:formylglycine-generating enzyme required for sulfatase activity